MSETPFSIDEQRVYTILSKAWATIREAESHNPPHVVVFAIDDETIQMMKRSSQVCGTPASPMQWNRDGDGWTLFGQRVINYRLGAILTSAWTMLP